MDAEEESGNLWKKLNCHVYEDQRSPRWGAKPKVKSTI